MELLEKIDEYLDYLNEKKWSGPVTQKAKWHPPAGFFKQSAGKIASGLKDASGTYKQAINRLTFYMNRAGKNLPEKDIKRLQKAKEELRKAYGK